MPIWSLSSIIIETSSRGIFADLRLSRKGGSKEESERGGAHERRDIYAKE